MKNLKKILLQYPEYILILIIIFYWFSSGVLINPVAIILLIILIVQIIKKNRISGIIISSLLMLSNFYMLFALISEFSEYSIYNADAKKMLVVGLSYFIFSMIICGIMIYKYLKIEK